MEQPFVGVGISLTVSTPLHPPFRLQSHFAHSSAALWAAGSLRLEEKWLALNEYHA